MTDEMKEYVIPIHWIRANLREEAYWEKGLCAARSTTTVLRKQETLDALIKHFELIEDNGNVEA